MLHVDSRCDLVLAARWILPVEPAGVVLRDHSLCIAGGRIAALLPTGQARQVYPHAPVVTLDRHVLLPGLVNAHTHAAMTLLRGLADDLPLMAWLQDHIWPAEARHVSHEFVLDGSLLACAEMLRGGITCFNDMYFFPEATAEAVLTSGMRACLGVIVLDHATSYAADADDALHKGLATRDAYKGEPRLRFALAPHAPYSVGDQSFAKVRTLADQLDLPVHVHLHETRDEIVASVQQYGLRPLARLEALDLLGPSLVGVHLVHLEPQEIDLLARMGAHMVHCPSSNLKLASGIAPVSAALAAGVNVCLGTDGAASNNRLDLFEEMRLAALLAKGTGGDPTVLGAHTAIAMATLAGARALGLADEIGSLLPGKAADVIAVDLSTLETQPCYDVASQLVYAAGRQHVSHVWVAGEPLLAEGRLTRVSEAELALRAAHWQGRIRQDGVPAD